ncbi:unnamed protein product, partial [Notodromas monacha]
MDLMRRVTATLGLLVLLANSIRARPQPHTYPGAWFWPRRGSHYTFNPPHHHHHHHHHNQHQHRTALPPSGASSLILMRPPRQNEDMETPAPIGMDDERSRFGAWGPRFVPVPRQSSNTWSTRWVTSSYPAVAATSPVQLHQAPQHPTNPHQHPHPHHYPQPHRYYQHRQHYPRKQQHQQHQSLHHPLSAMSLGVAANPNQANFGSKSEVEERLMQSTPGTVLVLNEPTTPKPT